MLLLFRNQLGEEKEVMDIKIYDQHLCTHGCSLYNQYPQFLLSFRVYAKVNVI